MENIHFTRISIFSSFKTPKTQGKTIIFALFVSFLASTMTALRRTLLATTLTATATGVFKHVVNAGDNSNAHANQQKPTDEIHDIKILKQGQSFEQ